MPPKVAFLAATPKPAPAAGCREVVIEQVGESGVRREVIRTWAVTLPEVDTENDPEYRRGLEFMREARERVARREASAVGP